MKITIHRGSNQIGGCVTEYEDKGWQLFVDYGEQLPGARNSDAPLIIEGLNHGDLSKSTLLITHYHGDHIGKIADLPPELPIFMGKIAKEIALKSASHKATVSEYHKKLAQRLETVKTFTPGEEFTFGNFKIMPVVMDHSAFDAYAFRIEARNLKVFHTGDFRTHGFRSSKLPAVIEKYVGQVDYVVCEGTNVSRPDAASKPEHELQWEFEQAFKDNKYNVVYLSTTNIDRLFGLYHAALRAHRPFYVDSFQLDMMDIVDGRDIIWGKSRLYRFKDGIKPIPLYKKGRNFSVNDNFIERLKEKGYVIIAREGDRFDKLLSEIPSEGRKTYLSMWDGYVDESNAAYIPSLAKSLANVYEYMHTSGHCDIQSMENLFKMLSPFAIIPIHTDNPHAFADLFSDKWPIILLEDGESFTVIKDPGWDDIEAKIIAYQKPDDSIEVIENADNLQWYRVIKRSLGEFPSREDADFALHHVEYASNRLLAYAIEEMEDMAPWCFEVYDPDFTLHSEFSWGGHKPRGERYHEKSPFAPGDIVYAIIDNDFLIPCTVIAPTTRNYFKNKYKEEGWSDEIIKDFIKDILDWDWDTIVVRPLVKIKSDNDKVLSDTAVPRIYLFPYRELE